LRVEHVVSSVSMCRRGNQLHQSAGALVGIRPWIPVRFRFDHRADQCRVHVMPLRCFSYEFLGAVAVDAHRRTISSRKRRFSGKVDGCARLQPTELKRSRRFGIDEQLPSRGVHDLGDLRAGRSNTKYQRRDKKPCRDCRAFRHRALGKAHKRFELRVRGGLGRRRADSSCEAVLAGMRPG
jgi:hypothetical protein